MTKSAGDPFVAICITVILLALVWAGMYALNRSDDRRRHSHRHRPTGLPAGRTPIGVTDRARLRALRAALPGRYPDGTEDLDDAFWPIVEAHLADVARRYDRLWSEHADTEEQ